MEKPIIFNAEMVRAILEGRKTQTRRTIKDKKLVAFIDFMTGHADEQPGNTEDLGQRLEGGKIRLWSAEYPEEGSELFRCPFGQAGDRLWVRETWAKVSQPDWKPDESGNMKYELKTIYKSDRKDFELKCYDDGFAQWKIKWKPSIHMPRWASRITLEITNIRVERVQEISGPDISREGICLKNLWHKEYGSTPLDQFRRIWNSVYGTWDQNPWVWVLEFKRIDKK